jgi:hypothetical protein
MCKGSQTTTTSSAASPEAQSILSNVVGGAQNTATANPYVPYTGQIAAPQNTQETAAESEIANAGGIAAPAYAEGTGLLNAGAGTIAAGAGTIASGVGALNSASGIIGQGVGALGSASGAYGADAALTNAGAGAVNPTQFSAAGVNEFMSPYTQDVVNSTEAQFNNQNAIQANQLTGSAILGGNAFGGDRAGVAQGVLAGQQQTAEAPVIAGLYNQDYSQALGEFNTQQGVNLSAGQANQARLLQAGAQLGQIGSGETSIGSTAGSLANTATGVGTAAGTLGSELGSAGTALGNTGASIAGLGQSQQTGALAAGNASLAAGEQAQATQQAQDTAAYQQYQLGEAFPYAQNSWLAGIDTAAATAMGGNSSTTGPPPSPLNALIGAVPSSIAMAGITGVATGGRITKGLGRFEHSRQGLASGGVPMFGGVPWLTPQPITGGKGVGIPNPPSLPQQAAVANFGDASGLIKGLQKNNTGPSGVPGTGVPGAGPSSYGGPNGPTPLVDPSIASADAAVSGIYASGGGVGFALGGMPRGIQMPPRIAPIKSPMHSSMPRQVGMGLGSSIMSRRGFADGGSPDDAPLSDRLDAATKAIADGTFDPMGADYNDFAPRSSGKGDRLPLVKDDRKILGLGEVPLPEASPAQNGVAQAIVNNTNSLPADDPDAPPFRIDGSYHDDPANNVPMTPGLAAANFDDAGTLPPQITRGLGASPSLPDGVLAYGPGVSRGVGSNNPPASLAPAGLGPAPDSSSAGPAGLGAAPASQPSPGILERLQSLSPEAKMALLTFGLQTMASRSPFPAVAVGEGGLAGVKSYAESQKLNAEQADKADQRAMEHQRVGIEATKLQQAAEAAKLAEQTAPLVKDKDGNIIPNPAQLALLKAQHEITDKDKLSPTNRTTADGRMIYYNHETGKEQVGDIVGEGKESWKPYPYLTPEGHPTQYNANGQIKDSVTQAILPPNTQLKSAKSNAMSPDAIEVAANQAAAGDLKSAYGNLGIGTAGAENKVAIRNSAIELLVKQGGMTPSQAAAYMSAANQEFEATGTGLKSQARTAGVREANLNIILKATDAAIPAAIEASRAVSRTGFVPLNQIIQKGEVMTSNPELKEFGMANLQLAEHWARAMNPTGVMRESDRDKALSFLSTADSQATYERAVMQLKKQIERERAAVHSISDKGGFSAPVGTTTAETAKAEIDAATKGKGGSTDTGATTAPAKPTLPEFLAKAKDVNPNASEEQLTAYYKKNYGG